MAKAIDLVGEWLSFTGKHCPSSPLVEMFLRKQQSRIDREYIRKDCYMKAFPCIATHLSNNGISFDKGQRMTREILEMIGITKEDK